MFKAENNYNAWKNLKRSQNIPSKKLKAIASTEKKPLNPVQKKQIKKLIGQEIEHKHHTREAAFQTLDTTVGAQFLLTNIPQQAAAGTDQVRNGDQVKIESIKIKLSFDNGSNLTTSPIHTNWRVLLIQDKSYNSTGTLTLADVFTNDPNPGVPSVLSARNRDHLGTKIILYDKTFTTGLYQAGKFLDVRPKLKYMKKHIQYNAGSTTNQEGGVYLVIFNDSNAVSDPFYSYQARLVFSDA